LHHANIYGTQAVVLGKNKGMHIKKFMQETMCIKRPQKYVRKNV